MDNVVCAICKGNFVSEDDFHGHLRTHKLSQRNYYIQYHPRYDLLTNQLIEFKNKDYYLSHDFNSKENMRAWLDRQSVETKQTYCSRLLISRKEKKQLLYAPTQVELRSIMCPSVAYLDDLFGNYYWTCAALGFINKYHKFETFPPKRAMDDRFVILEDTREQKPLKFPCITVSRKLDFGDYCFADESWTNNCYVERKSITDFIGTLSGGLDRFKREIERAGEKKASLVIVVEEVLSQCLDFRNLPFIPHNIRATPEFIFRNVRELIQEYPFIQFAFVNGRSAASKFICDLFAYGTLHKKHDLQLLIDKKVL